MASVENNYEINVAKKRKPEDEYGVHFCTIQLRSDVYRAEDAEKELQFFRDLFGDQYHVSMTYWDCKGIHKKGWE